MRLAKKKYGYTIALWEVGDTSPSLFQETANFKASMGIPTTQLWKSMITPSRMPWPLRLLLSNKSLRDVQGDAWNLCHYWSNFEIADLDFFRSKGYRDFFRHLDLAGGFYYERVCWHRIHGLAA